MTNLKYIVLLIISLLSLKVQAQNWETTQGEERSEVFYDCMILPDGSIISVGNKDPDVSGPTGLWITKTNPNGLKLWENSYHLPSSPLNAVAVDLHPNGHLFVFGNELAPDGYYYNVLWEVNSSGNTVNFSNDSPTGYQTTNGFITNDGGIVSVGTVQGFQSNYAFGFIGMWVYINSTTPTFGNYAVDSLVQHYTDATELSDGRLAATGFAWINGQDLDIVLTIMEQDGTNRIDSTYGTIYPELAFGLAEFEEEIYIVGSKKVADSTGTDVLILKTNLDGEEQAIWVDEQSHTRVGRDLAITQDGNIWVVGEDKEGNEPFQFLLNKFDANGNLQLDRLYGGPSFDNGRGIKIKNENSIVAVGAATPFNHTSSDGYILNLDSLGNTFPAQVQGQVFWDENENCEKNAEPSLGNWLIELQGSFSQWTISDSDGNYHFNADTGDYQLIVYPPNDYWVPCDIAIPVNIQNQDDTISIDPGIKTGISCPLLTVDLGTSFLRRCFENNYHVEVCNQGTAIAEGAFVEIELDPYFTFVNASITETPLSDILYRFDLGDIAPGECHQFQMTILVDCDSTVLGQTHCLEARAFPDTICNPLNPNWDLSSIELDAVCLGDSVDFIISNTGAGATTVPTEYVIIEDHIMLFQGNVELDPGKDTLITFPANGRTLRLEAEQAIGHPGQSMPAIAVEGCGGFPFSLGYIIQYPQNDGNPFVDIDCRENVGSYDPNDKQAFPAGYRDEHFIEANTALEYLIRFQNTGTDTAFTVVIRDTLDFNLNMATLNMGSSSHPYIWNIYNESILEIHFNNILLPDSTVNEEGSHGYVKFTIDQVPGLKPGAMIYNQAAIFFDFNPPIITNQTYHTIGNDYIIIDLIDSSIDPQKTAAFSIGYYPNPFLEQINFELINIPNGYNLGFKLFNAQGVLIHFQDIKSNRFSYFHKDRSPGVYFFQIIADQKIIKTGKIIHHN